MDLKWIFTDATFKICSKIFTEHGIWPVMYNLFAEVPTLAEFTRAISIPFPILYSLGLASVM